MMSGRSGVDSTSGASGSAVIEGCIVLPSHSLQIRVTIDSEED